MVVARAWNVCCECCCRAWVIAGFLIGYIVAGWAKCAQAGSFTSEIERTRLMAVVLSIVGLAAHVLEVVVKPGCGGDDDHVVLVCYDVVDIDGDLVMVDVPVLACWVGPEVSIRVFEEFLDRYDALSMLGTTESNVLRFFEYGGTVGEYA